MARLNTRKEYGEVSPPWHGACFEQDGRLFDAEGEEVVVPGYNPPPAPQPLETQAPSPAADKPAEKSDLDAPEIEPQGYSPAELIVIGEDMPFFTFRAAAKQILGEDSTPRKKADIVDALRGMILGTYSAEPEQVEEPAPLPEEPIVDLPPVAEGEVDLVLWAKGGANYMFSDVRVAIRDKYNRQVSSTQNAVEALIDEGVVKAEQARVTSPMPMS
jgi:hypothetical protein